MTTALITEASRELGRTLAATLAGWGADVGLVARSVDGLRETTSICEQQGARASVVPTEITIRSQHSPHPDD